MSRLSTPALVDGRDRKSIAYSHRGSHRPERPLHRSRSYSRPGYFLEPSSSESSDEYARYSTPALAYGRDRKPVAYSQWGSHRSERPLRRSRSYSRRGYPLSSEYSGESGYSTTRLRPRQRTTFSGYGESHGRDWDDYDDFDTASGSYFYPPYRAGKPIFVPVPPPAPPPAPPPGPPPIPSPGYPLSSSQQELQQKAQNSQEQGSPQKQQQQETWSKSTREPSRPPYVPPPHTLPSGRSILRSGSLRSTTKLQDSVSGDNNADIRVKKKKKDLEDRLSSLERRLAMASAPPPDPRYLGRYPLSPAPSRTRKKKSVTIPEIPESQTV